MAKKKPQKTLFIAKNDNYDMETLVSVGLSTQEIVDWFKKNTEEELSEEFIEALDCGGVARTVVSGNVSVIRFSEWEETPYYLGILAHEVFHLAEMTFKKIGLPHCVDCSSEAYAYFIGATYKNIYTGITSWKPKNK